MIANKISFAECMGGYVEIKNSEGVFRYASRIASSRSMRETGTAELQNQNREFNGYPRRAQIDGHY